jgi:hypothetical protein
MPVSASGSSSATATPSSPPPSTQCSPRPASGSSRHRCGRRGQRDRQTLRRHPPRTPRTQRPPPDHQSAPRHGRASAVRAAFQRTPATPRARPGRSPTTLPAAPPPPRSTTSDDAPTQRPDSRISAGCMRCAEFLAPTGRPRGPPPPRPVGSTRRWHCSSCRRGLLALIFDPAGAPLRRAWVPGQAAPLDLSEASINDVHACWARMRWISNGSASAPEASQNGASPVRASARRRA